MVSRTSWNGGKNFVWLTIFSRASLINGWPKSISKNIFNKEKVLMNFTLLPFRVTGWSRILSTEDDCFFNSASLV